jgi:hypothetical protein
MPLAQLFKTLTLKPHWAHAVIRLGKNVENRSWVPRYRGPLLIHAGSGFHVGEFNRLREIAKEDGRRAPKREDVLIGGIVGIVDFYDVVEDSDSDWFGGPYGWLFRRIKPLPFLPMTGRLGLYDIDPPASWRRKAGL